MATPRFLIEINGNSVAVTKHTHSAVPDEAVLSCVQSKLMKDWAASVDPDLIISEVLLKDCDFFGKRIGFLKIEAVATFHGVRVPGICFLRGGAVSILVILHCEEDDKDYVILTRQPRVPVGSAGLLELPAGMIDDEQEFAGVAAKELKEETGLILNKENLIDLTALVNGVSGVKPVKGMLPSAGGCDEFLRSFLHKRTVTRTELDAMRGKATGLLEEGEVIILDIVDYKDVWKICSDAKLLSSMFLYERLSSARVI
jgi:ADP-sugar diphosphatase